MQKQLLCDTQEKTGQLDLSILYARTNQTFRFPRRFHLKSKDILQRANMYHLPYYSKFTLDLSFLSPLERNLF